MLGREEARGRIRKKKRGMDKEKKELRNTENK